MAWPIFQSVYPEPFKYFAQTCVEAGRLSRYDFGVGVLERTLLHDAMNTFVQHMLATEAQALIVFDDDCRPPQGTIARLLKHWEAGADVVAAMGFMRNYPHKTTIGRFFPEGISLQAETGEMDGLHWLDDVSRLQGVVEVDFCGFPVALLSRRILERMTFPWFATQDEDGGKCTHDVYFCQKAKKAGARILVDTDLRCDHLGAAHWITFENRDVIRAVREKGLAPEAIKEALRCA